MPAGRSFSGSPAKRRPATKSSLTSADSSAQSEHCAPLNHRESGLKRHQPTEFGASIVEATELRVGDRPGPDRISQARLVVQCPIRPFNCLLELSRHQMRVGEAGGIQIAKRIEAGSNAFRLIEGFDCWLWLTEVRVKPAFEEPRNGRVWIECDGTIDNGCRKCYFVGEISQGEGCLHHSLCVITLYFQHSSGTIGPWC